MAERITFCSLRNTDFWWHFTRIRANWNARSVVCNWVQATKFVSASEQTTIIVPHTEYCPQHKATAQLSEALFTEHKNYKDETGQKIDQYYQYSAQLPTELTAIPSFTSAKNSVLWVRILAYRTSNKPNKQRPRKLDSNILILSDAKHFTEIPTEFCKSSFFNTTSMFETLSHLRASGTAFFGLCSAPLKTIIHYIIYIIKLSQKL